MGMEINCKKKDMHKRKYNIIEKREDRLEVLKLRLMINKIPNEINNIIIRMSYKKKHPDILCDIRHFCKTHNIIKEDYIYSNFRYNLLGNINIMTNINDREDMSIIQNNILYYGINNKINLFSRLKIKPNKEKIMKFIDGFINIYKFGLKKYNTYWGLFTIEERDNFVLLIEDIKNKNFRYSFFNYDI